MSILKVDKDKCCRDGACISVCPVRIIDVDSGSGFPKPVEGHERLCINCGHCVAVCPTKAISLQSMPAEKCESLTKDWRVSPEKLSQFLKGRRSIRNYKKDPVDRAVIERLIDTARYAPTGINRQPVSWAVVHDAEKMKELSRLVIEWMKVLVNSGSQLAASLRMESSIRSYEGGGDPIMRGAPHLIVAYSLKEDMTAPQACTIAITYMEIMAASMGLGACWAGYVQMAINMSSDIKKFLGMSRKTDAFGALMLGYPKYEYRRIPMRNEAHVIWR